MPADTVQPLSLTHTLRDRLSAALIGLKNVRDPGLKARLRDMLMSDSAKNGLIRDPVFQAAWPYVSSEDALEDLSGGLLHSETVRALSQEGPESFPLDRKPYRHQRQAWETLSPTSAAPRSAVISSGTGSGKTECFLVPMLDDFVRQVARGKGGPGVQAIMLYPLNALIESQRERLDAWTRPLKGKVRYGLYNGDMDDRKRANELRQHIRDNPQEIVDRTSLRDAPPQILVTNITMLEYMMVRPQDAPILEQSRGKLRWIVLDEAHTYVGAAAAEVALLLRRVMNGFGVKAEDVRFVATSATIGSGSETDIEALRRFLADVAGVDPANVDVITGDTRKPVLPELGADGAAKACCAEPDGAQPDALFDALGQSPAIRPLLNKLRGGFARATDVDAAAGALDLDPDRLMSALSSASKGGDFLAPVRVHLFQRALGGLWTCVDPACPEADAEREAGWVHGALYLEHRKNCECGMPVLDVTSCRDCGEIALAGRYVTRGAETKLLPRPLDTPTDEFDADAFMGADAQDEQDGDGSEGVPPISGEGAWFALRSSPETMPMHIGAQGEEVHTPDAARLTLSRLQREDTNCPFCRARGGYLDALFPFRMGAPFSMSSAMPSLIKAMPKHKAGLDTERPSSAPNIPVGGRQLLSFTDSRQGTARLSAQLQQDAERAFVRSFLYDTVQKSLSGGASEEARATAQAEIDSLAPLAATNPVIANLVAEKRKVLEGSTDGISWSDLVARLTERPETGDWMAKSWSGRHPAFSGEEGAANIARTILYTELLRRPKTANSAETLGLVRFRTDVIDNASAPQVRGLPTVSDKDWRAFLYYVLTYLLRVNNAVALPKNGIKSWIKKNLFLDAFMPPGREGDRRSQRDWPRVKQNGRQIGAVDFLTIALDLDLSDPVHADGVNTLMERAYNALASLLDGDPGKQLDFSKLHVAPVTDAFLCPMTRTVTDIAPFGLSPYARTKSDRAEPIVMPRMPDDLTRAGKEDWLSTDRQVAALRERGVWGDIHDRTARFAPYFRTAEHSAQNDRARLKSYEDIFKRGEINVLNCSTTMEMGVDIGGINGVVMSNLPPSIANYQQRVGRAGRRGQSVSVGYTVAKPRALDQEAFRDPERYLTRETNAPRVDLRSVPLVERHVCAHLLGRFLRRQDANALSMHVGDFFGFQGDLREGGKVRRPAPERQVTRFYGFLDKHGDDADIRHELRQIVRGTQCAGRDDLVAMARGRMKAVEAVFADECEALIRQHGTLASNASAQRGVSIQLMRLCEEFLLSELADRGFLPGHGFPTHVVQMHISRRDLDAGEDQKRRRPKSYGSMPSRPLPVAIREFAPGADLMVDGVVYRSGGVTLNWKRPDTQEGVRDVQSLRRLVDCAECGHGAIVAQAPNSCEACGAPLRLPAEILKPAGFCQDYRVSTHRTVAAPDFVPAQPTLFSANDGPWGQLPDPRLGRIRASRTGRVIHHTKGPGGEGYGLCLECGRMEPMKPGEDACTALQGHKPLRADKNWEHLCPGNDKTYTQRHGLLLGHDAMTDVCEIVPSAPMEEAVATSLALALRQSLAARLGVETADIGWGIKRARNAMSTQTYAIGLFDTPAGGAGYSSSLPDMLDAVFNDACALLDCPAECESACSSCILSHDAPWGGASVLDRKGALAFMQDELAFEEALPEGAPDGAMLEPMLVDSLSRRLQPGDRLQLFMDVPDPAALSAWSLHERVDAWHRKGVEVTLVLPEGAQARLETVQRELLRDWLIRQKAGLAVWSAPEERDWRPVAQIVHRDGTVTTYLASDDGLFAPTPDWPSEAEQCALSTQAHPVVETSARALDTLKAPPGAVYRKLGAELEGPVRRFAPALAELLNGALGDLGVAPDEIVKAHYSDRYCKSPLTQRLIADTVRHAWPGVSLAVETDPPDPQRRPWAVHSDFEDRDDLKVFARDYGALQGQTLSAHARTDLPHNRRLTLTCADGRRVALDFDKGMGFVRYEGRDRAVHNGDVATATARLSGRLSLNETGGSQVFARLLKAHEA